ncbi:osmoprotectant transport system permease protein [Luteibacter sp. UNCMF331Sha3.1]|uniref:ABC transporter permease n=1 Tax=Luteibacter sp. UNCMF331Sha3.1 TaxID=1502760 RepID=UPI0008CFCB8E|nr:ABC transporter permease [Luteibacter sp. UNCMF331Sha3.1]SEM38417.1 osmoprotectant transport system permease protein [Luteibacter sp. UNCMF331Sha3.1]
MSETRTRGEALPILVLSTTALLAAAFLPMLHVAPNRLLAGVPTSPHTAWLFAAWGVAIVCGAVRFRGHGVVVASIAWLAVAGLPWLAGMSADTILDGAARTTRVQLASGFWVTWLAAALLLLDRLRGTRVVVQAGAWGAALAVVVALTVTGAFDGLALVREWQAQRAPFAQAVVVHVRLAAITLVLAVLTGGPLGWWVWRRRRADGIVVGLLAFLQTVPSLALFALLIGPFAWLARAWPTLGALGFGGTGAAPAVFALWLYALLPVVRYTVAGLGAVPEDARDAARGLGMSRLQVLWRVQLPLGWPVLLAGLRIVAVQTIGLAVVAALIGAGGLGRFVFLGIGQGAIDMVLLGTLGIIVLALTVDLAFQVVLALTERRA